MSIYTT